MSFLLFRRCFIFHLTSIIRFHPANKKQVDKYPHEYVANSHGTSGPIQTTVMHHSATIDNLYQETVVGMGMRKIKDPYAGDITGTWISHGTVLNSEA